MPPQDPFSGRDILNGQFRILQKIGSGGMGAVYKALEVETNRMVGVKLLHPRLVNRQDLASRFRREAHALSQLAHPNTVKVYRFGELDDGSLYIIMELLEGKNLNQTVRADGPFPVDRALPILIEVCGALHEAHLAGIVHRDLKPENIFLVQSGGLRDFPKVLDFGLAKLGDRQLRPGSVALTQEGMVFGTPEFMSPEQAQGKTLTSASDIYSLAVILYEVLTGKLPFDARTSVDYIQLHVTGQPIPLNRRVSGRTFPPALEDIIGKALAKRPDERFATAAEFADAMHSMGSGSTRVRSAGGSPFAESLATTEGVSAPAAAAGGVVAREPAAAPGLRAIAKPSATRPSATRPSAADRAARDTLDADRPEETCAQRTEAPAAFEQPAAGCGERPASSDSRAVGRAAKPNLRLLFVVALVSLAIGAGLAFVLAQFVAH